MGCLLPQRNLNPSEPYVPPSPVDSPPSNVTCGEPFFILSRNAGRADTQLCFKARRGALRFDERGSSQQVRKVKASAWKLPWSLELDCGLEAGAGGTRFQNPNPCPALPCPASARPVLVQYKYSSSASASYKKKKKKKIPSHAWIAH